MTGPFLNQTLTNHFLCFVLTMVSVASHSAALAQQENQGPEMRQLISQPFALSDELVGEQGFMVVPENRAKPESREITVHYIRLRTGAEFKRPPVFVLPGGPGEPFTESRLASWMPLRKGFSLMTEIVEYLKDRDVILVNQRGNQRAPGLLSREFVMFAEPANMDRAFQISTASERLTEGAEKSYRKWEAMGMDLSGYDILNLVDDINDLRASLGYEKICLRGSSFGTQSSLAYIRRYPTSVDRAILHGVEPLDYGYDDPSGIWKVYRRLDKMAAQQSDLGLDEGQLLSGIKTLIERLEEKPVKVRSRHPTRDLTMDVTLGADDLRKCLSDTRAGNTRRDSLEYWPAYIKEMLNGEFRYLASFAIDDRPEYYQGIIMAHLMDNSLGISPQREHSLDNSEAARWLGDINWRFKATRKVARTQRVADQFVKFQSIDIPILMVQGDLDTSTPYENAKDLLPHLKNGHLITIAGGTHGTVRDAVRSYPDFPKHLFRFMKTEFDKTNAKDFFDSMPKRIELPALNFKNPKKALFEIFVEKN